MNEEQKVLAVAEKNCVAVNMDILRIVCLEIAKTMKSNQLLCGRGIPRKYEGFEKESPLNLVFLTILYFISLCTWKLWHGDAENAWGYACVHRILHISKNSENYTFIMNH